MTHLAIWDFTLICTCVIVYQSKSSTGKFATKLVVVHHRLPFSPIYKTVSGPFFSYENKKVVGKKNLVVDEVKFHGEIPILYTVGA